MSLDTAIWQAADGNQIHKLSNVVFPARIQGYVRTKTNNFATDGLDVGIVYVSDTRKRGEIDEISLYVTHVSKFATDTVDAKQYADDAARTVQTRWKQAKYLQGGNLSVQGSPFVKGPFHLFEVKLRSKMYRTGVWTKRHEDWLLKARFTYLYEETESDKIMSMLEKALNKEMSSTGLRVQMTNKDGAVSGMEHVVDLLSGVQWSE